MSEPISALHRCQGLFKQQQVSGKKEITCDGCYKMLEEICAPIDEVDTFVNRVVKPAVGVKK